jgi:hypothetical protein
VKEVLALEAYRLHIKFMDDLEGHVDLSKFIVREDAGVFSALLDPQLFKNVYLDLGAVTWPGELDLAPDAMYEEIKKNGEWVIQ